MCPTNLTDALNNPAGVVGYLANNRNAQYIEAGYGALATVGRNTLQLKPINDIDLTALKRFTITERFKIEFRASATNVLNHAQYVGGFLNDVAAYSKSRLHNLSAEHPGAFESVFQQPERGLLKQSASPATGFEDSLLSSFQLRSRGDRKTRAENHTQTDAAHLFATGTWDWLGVLGRAATMVVPGARIELATPAFSGRRSTTELPRH